MLLSTLRTCQVVWDLASNSPRFLTLSMAAASNLLYLSPIQQSGPKDEETDPEQNLWVRLLGTDLSCQDNPKIPRQPHCRGPRRLSAKISQDITEKSRRDLGQVRLWCDWHWWYASQEALYDLGMQTSPMAHLKWSCALWTSSSHSG